MISSSFSHLCQAALSLVTLYCHTQMMREGWSVSLMLSSLQDHLVSADMQSKATEEDVVESKKEVADLKEELQTHVMAADRYRPNACNRALSCACALWQTKTSQHQVNAVAWLQTVQQLVGSPQAEHLPDTASAIG